MSKKFEVNLTPQNQEWIGLIPNATQNNDIVFNKLLEIAISEGILLEVISQSLTITDLAKFKTAYMKMQAKRAEHMGDLEITPTHIERKRVVQTQTLEMEEEIIDADDFEEVPSPKTITPKKTGKKVSHGFDEDTF